MLHNAKKIFFIELNTADKKKFWKAMKYLWKEQNTISVLSHNGSTAHLFGIVEHCNSIVS